MVILGVVDADLVRLDINDIVLLQIVVGRVHDVGIIQVQRVISLVTVTVLPDEGHIVSDTIDRQVTGS